MLPQEYHVELIENLGPSMRYNGEIPFEEWQVTAREKLMELLGLPFEKVEPDVQIEYEREQDEFTDICFTFQSERNYRPLCRLLLPRGATKPLPVMILLGGHGKGMHVYVGENLYKTEKNEEMHYRRKRALQTIREGYAALLIEQRGFGQRGGTEEGPSCTHPAMTALLLGRTLLGERVWDVSRAIDVLEQYFPQVDTNHLACAGGSGGGTATFYSACIDERIKIAGCSCSICSFKHSISPIYHCPCNYVPQIAKYFDMGDMGGLIAPRQLIIDGGAKDPIFLIEGTIEAFDMIKKLYTYAGAEKNCELIIGDCGHAFSYEEFWEAFNRLSGWKGLI